MKIPIGLKISFWFTASVVLALCSVLVLIIMGMLIAMNFIQPAVSLLGMIATIALCLFGFVIYFSYASYSLQKAFLYCCIQNKEILKQVLEK